MDKKCIIVDLDHTFMRCNTFHKWLLFLARRLFWKKPQLVISICYFMLMRFLKRITHKSLKRNVISLVNKNLILINEKRFVDELHNYINLRIRNELENKREGEIWILATAAPMIYAQIIGGVYKFDYTLGTSMDTDSGNWTENLKEVKAKNVIDLTKKLNLLEINRLYTDHHDDIPLMKLVDKTILVNPSEKTVDLVKESGITNYEIIIDN